MRIYEEDKSTTTVVLKMIFEVIRIVTIVIGPLNVIMNGYHIHRINEEIESKIHVVFGKTYAIGVGALEAQRFDYIVHLVIWLIVWCALWCFHIVRIREKIETRKIIKHGKLSMGEVIYVDEFTEDGYIQTYAFIKSEDNVDIALATELSKKHEKSDDKEGVACFIYEMNDTKLFCLDREGKRVLDEYRTKHPTRGFQEKALDKLFELRKEYGVGEQWSDVIGRKKRSLGIKEETDVESKVDEDCEDDDEIIEYF